MMATNYGIDVAAVTDRPDPDVLANGPRNLANALARRLLAREGCLEDIGDSAPYACLNLRDYLGERMSADDLRILGQAMTRVLSQDDRVESVSARATYASGILTATISGTGAAGPFQFVLSVSDVTAARLQVL